MSNQLACPKCRLLLKLAKPMPAGSTIKCPQCATVFKTGAEMTPVAGPGPAAAPKPAPPAAPSRPSQVAPPPAPPTRPSQVTAPLPPAPPTRPSQMATAPLTPPTRPSQVAVSPPAPPARPSQVTASPPTRPSQVVPPAPLPSDPPEVTLDEAPDEAPAAPANSKTSAIMAKSAVVLSALAAASKKGAAASWKGARWSAQKGYEVSKPAVIKLGAKARADKRVAIALAGGSCLLLLVVAVTAYSFLGKSKVKPKEEPDVVAVETNSDTSIADVFKPSAEKKDPPKTSVPMSGNLTPDVLKKVKKSTLYLRVETAGGQVGSGSGFFSFEPGIVLTNAHVVDMLREDSSAPRKIDAVINSGEKDEKTFSARVLDVDRSSDLAVLRLSGDLDSLPEPLSVNSAKELMETQQVFIFGFPFGESLGKNITISTSSVSSLRKNDQGELAQIQVNGGMHPGNSGGPVVDPLGNVVGVAVAGIRGTQINFAIPGDYVHIILNGRIKDVSYGTPTRRGENIAVPVTIRTIDPLKRIKKVGIDWWLGKQGDNRPAATTQPETASGDSKHQTVYLTYRGDTATGEVLMAGSSEGKSYWVQPLFLTSANQTHWNAANVFVPDIVDAKPSTLLVKHQVGEVKMSLKTKTSYKLRSPAGEDHTYLSAMDAKVTELTREVDPLGNAQRRLQITKMDLTELRDGRPWAGAPNVKNIDHLSFDAHFDRQGNLTQRRIDLGGQSALKGIGDKVLYTLDANSVPIPGSNVNPGQTWPASRTVPIDALLSSIQAQVDLTYTYRGLRTRNGRQEAILGMTGVIRSPQGLTAKLRGSTAFDPAFGQIVQSQAIIEVNFRIRGSEAFEIEGSTEFNLERTPPGQ